MQSVQYGRRPDQGRLRRLSPGESGSAQLLPCCDSGRHPGSREARSTPTTILAPANALVVDDTEAFGVGVANSFTEEFEALGGTTLPARQQRLRDQHELRRNPDRGRYPTSTSCTSAALRSPAVASCAATWAPQALLDVPFVGPDGTDRPGPRRAEGTMITLTGVENADNVFGTVAGANASSSLTSPPTSTPRYEEAFGSTRPARTARWLTCARRSFCRQSTRTSAALPTSPSLRSAVREHVFVRRAVRYGPRRSQLRRERRRQARSGSRSTRRIVSLLNDGLGGWVFDKQQDFSCSVCRVIPCLNEPGSPKSGPPPSDYLDVSRQTVT